ncbi:putative hemolysin [Gregarina niphandrodes]|uniref:Hemolysin n=1 Tax=Gregarina niphandrodes TaxID=110365 RepID=A0A023B2J0_GRENI|nr:putative hemolysin [Gregarina niphandrodes]EZG53787.1 putative hemolysin [Gregarina niphandrodes]|eukprot:XP_011131862.1 putative hemolysin [Gregarina niphandrodes]
MASEMHEVVLDSLIDRHCRKETCLHDSSGTTSACSNSVVAGSNRCDNLERRSSSEMKLRSIARRRGRRGTIFVDQSWPPRRRGRAECRSIDLINALYDTPLLRGKIHIVLLVASPLWACGLLRHCRSGWSLCAGVISVVSCIFNFGSSSLLHNIHRVGMYERTFWRQLDHVGIFSMIAGSAAPVPLLTFSSTMLGIWTALQVVCLFIGTFTCFRGDSFSNQNSYGGRALIYVVVGLLHASFFREFQQKLTSTEQALLTILASGYIIGAAAYATKRPNPAPKVFGYHECFHALCFFSGVLTYVLNVSVVDRYQKGVESGRLHF